MIGTVSGISGVSYKIINNIKNNISLQLKDKSEYSAVVGKTDGLEPENNEGRGLILRNTVCIGISDGTSGCGTR